LGLQRTKSKITQSTEENILIGSRKENTNVREKKSLNKETKTRGRGGRVSKRRMIQGKKKKSGCNSEKNPG